ISLDDCRDLPDFHHPVGNLFVAGCGRGLEPLRKKEDARQVSPGADRDGPAPARESVDPSAARYGNAVAPGVDGTLPDQLGLERPQLGALPLATRSVFQS